MQPDCANKECCEKKAEKKNESKKIDMNISIELAKKLATLLLLVWKLPRPEMVLCLGEVITYKLVVEELSRGIFEKRMPRFCAFVVENFPTVGTFENRNENELKIGKN